MIVIAIYARKSTEQTGADADAKSVPRQIKRCPCVRPSKGAGLSPRPSCNTDEAVSGAETKKLISRQRLCDVLARAGRRSRS